MDRKLQLIGITLVILFSIGCGFLTGTPQPPQPPGWIKIVNSHVRGSDTFPGCDRLPVAREYGVCFIAYNPDNPAALTTPMFDMILAKDEQTTTYALPPGSYQLQEFIADSEINMSPGYLPCFKGYVRPPETIVITAETTIVFGSERTLPAPGDFVEGNTINPSCGGSWTATPNPTEVTYVGRFAGQWDTNWGDMTCSVDGVRVYCEYTHDQGKIDATLSADGRTMDGQWTEFPSYSPPADGGRVTFTLSEDGNAIDGEWWYGQDNYGGSWTGTRK